MKFLFNDFFSSLAQASSAAAARTVLGLGETAIKVKELTGTTGAAQGSLTTVAHGLAGDKIISITASKNRKVVTMGLKRIILISAKISA